MKSKLLTGVLGILCLFLLTKIYTKNQQLKDCTVQLEVVTNTADSLKAEILPIEIELGRYQVAYQIFMERNPKAAEQYGTIISEETE